MQRINMTHPGGVDVLYIEDAALPAPEAGELLIKTANSSSKPPTPASTARTSCSAKAPAPCPRALPPSWGWNSPAK